MTRMHIHEVQINGIKNLEQTSLILHPNPGEKGCVTVMSRPSGSGKTTVLQMIAGVCAASYSAAWLASPRVRSGWVAQNAPEEGGQTRVRIIPTKEDEHKNPRPVCVDLSLTWPRSGAVPVLRPSGNTSKITHLPFWAPEFCVSQGWMLAGYGAHRTQSTSSNLSQELLDAVPRIAAITHLFREDAALDRGEQWFSNLVTYTEFVSRKHPVLEPTSTILGIQAFLGDGLLKPGKQEVTTRLMPAEPMHEICIDGKPIETIGRVAKGRLQLVLDILFRIDQFSPGWLTRTLKNWPAKTQPVLHYAGVVLIDEIDAELSEMEAVYFIDWLQTHFPLMQFIVTTSRPLGKLSTPYTVI